MGCSNFYDIWHLSYHILNQAMAEALAMPIESRSIEGARLTSICRLKQHTSLGRHGQNQQYQTASKLLSLQSLTYLLKEALLILERIVYILLMSKLQHSVYYWSVECCIRQTEWMNEWRTHKPSTVTLTAHACRRLIMTSLTMLWPYNFAIELR